jgi:PPP family 3-phenylpropionic acid transporter
MIDALYGQTMQNPNKSYGRARLAGSLGFILAALTAQLTGWIDGAKPLSVFLGYTFCYLVFIGITITLPTTQIHRNTDEDHEPVLKTVRSFPLIFWVGMSIAFLSALGLSGHYTFFSLLLKDRFNRTDVGGFWALCPILEMPLFFFSSYLLQKFSLKKLWILCLGAGIIRLQVYSLADSVLPLYLVQLLHSFTFALNHLCMMTVINQTTSQSSRGLAMSIYTALGTGLPLFAGGIMGGWILRSGDFRLLYQIFSLFPFLGVCISLFILKGHKEITCSA